jgi:CRISPR/Cas system CMR-associated protein Cmr5 small subunit
VYEYQNTLLSSKEELKRDKKALVNYENLYNALPDKRDNLLWQQKENIISKLELKEHIEKLSMQKEAYMKKINELQNKISENTLSEGYLKSITEFSERYKVALDDIINNREEIATILRMIVDSIVVNTREVNETDIIA